MSIAEQLQRLKNPVVSIFDVNTKNKKSLLYEDGYSIGRAEALQKCKKEFMILCHIDSKFKQFGSLYSEDTADLVPQQLLEHQFLDLKKNITHFLCLLTKYLDKDFAIGAFEWLVYKYEIHIQQPEDLLMCCFPFHNNKIFIKFIRLLDTRKTEFSWLHSISKEGNPFSVLDLVNLCLKNVNVLEMICSWPIKIVEITNCDQDACKELCNLMICMGLNILDKILLMTKEKCEKYLSPFIRLIVDGLKTTHENFNSTAVILLLYFSEKINLDKKFLKSSLKKILTIGTINQFVALRAIVDICYFQKYVFKSKLESLFQKNFNELNVEEKKSIEESMNDNSDKNEEAIMSNYEMEIEEIKIEPSVKKYQVIWNETKNTINIEWTSDQIENQLVELLLKYVLNWISFSNIVQMNNGKKIALDVLKLLKEKPAELKFEYKPGGILAHLSCSIMYPDNEIQKTCMKLLGRFSKTRSNILNFKKQIIGEDLENLYYGKVSELILAELNGLNLSSLTISILTISMINSKNLINIPKFDNIWNMLISKLTDKEFSNENNYIFRHALQGFFHRIGSSFLQLSDNHQQILLSSLSSNLKQEMRDIFIEYLAYLPLSIENYKFLLKDIGSSENGEKRKSIKKFKNDISSDFYSEDVVDKINVALSVFCRGQFMSINDQLVILEKILIVLKRIGSNLSSNTDPISCDEKLTETTINIMSAILCILTSVIQSKETINLEYISDKISLEIFSKCLYLFQNSNLNELTLLVIQNIVKLGLGSQRFNLIYFISWIGNHLVPKEDQKSLSILISIINETLPLCIKQKSQNSSDKVQIIINFIRECSVLPKHRVLVLFQSIVKSLSVSNENENENVLWIQLLFMLAVKTSGNCLNPNEYLIIPLLKMFSPEEQIFTLKKIIMFLAYFIQDPSRKRKFINTDASDSPLNKKRKTMLALDSANKSCSNDDGEKYFLSVKENLLALEKNINSIQLLKTIISYSLIYLKENSDGLLTVPEHLKEFIGNIFGSMKFINISKISIPQKNEICQLFRQIIEQIGMSLSRNLYFSLIVDLVIKETDESIKSKCLELLANKFSIMVKTNIIIKNDTEFEETICSIMPLLCDVIVNKSESSDWNTCLLCVSNLVALGFMSKEELVEEAYSNIFSNLINTDFNQITYDKVILINIFFKNFIISDKYRNLLQVFNCSLNVIDKCINNCEFNNGEIESSLSLMHAIISRVDSSSIGWENFEKILDRIFQLVSLRKLKNLSQHSSDYQKQIRLKLSQMTDTKSLISTCASLIEKGIVIGDNSYVSGSVSVFGCHLTNLNKLQIKYCPDEHESDIMWKFVCQSLSVNEKKSEWNSIIEISIKALNQLCYLMHFNIEIMMKLKEFIQKSDLSAKFYLERNSTYYQFVCYLIDKSKKVEKTIEFVNNSELISNASGFLKHLSVEIKSKNKRRKVKSTFLVPFASDLLITECPVESGELLKQICNALLSLLRAENKCGMNLSISDETIDFISNICRCMLSIDKYLDKVTYQTITEKHMIPLIAQIAINSFNDEALLTPLAFGLCKHFTEINPIAHYAILKTLAELKECLGCTFDSSIRENVLSFLEDCKLHDDENIADLANEI